MKKKRPGEDGAITVIAVNSAQIAAANLQITLGRKLGNRTLGIVKKIAAAK